MTDGQQCLSVLRLSVAVLVCVNRYAPLLVRMCDGSDDERLSETSDSLGESQVIQTKETGSIYRVLLFFIKQTIHCTKIGYPRASTVLNQSHHDKIACFRGCMCVYCVHDTVKRTHQYNLYTLFTQLFICKKLLVHCTHLFRLILSILLIILGSFVINK